MKVAYTPIASPLLLEPIKSDTYANPIGKTAETPNPMSIAARTSCKGLRTTISEMEPIRIATKPIIIVGFLPILSESIPEGRLPKVLDRPNTGDYNSD